VTTHRGERRSDQPEVPATLPEVDNPAFAPALRRPDRQHPFDGDEHGHDLHDTIPAEEEWVEDALRPDKEHNPQQP